MVFVDSQPRFEPAQVTVRAGTVAFFLDNVPGPSTFYYHTHNMQIGPELGQVLAGSSDVKTDDKAIFTVGSLAPGTYVFWCSVPTLDGKDHAAYGMVGTLTVTP